MHELPIIKSIYKTVIPKAEAAGAKEIRRVVLEVGVLRDFVPEFMQKYWEYISKGGIAQGAVLEIREIEAMAHCACCSNDYKIPREHLADARCPVCGYDRGTIIAGDEFRIVGIEIVSDKTSE